MIDTVRVAHIEKLPPLPVLRERNFRGYHDPWTGELVRWVNNPPKGSHLPRLTWSFHEAAPSRLFAEVSLAKMVLGTNVKTPSDSDIERGLDLLSDYVSEVAGVNFDSRQSLVNRVDYAENWSVGEGNIKPYVAALSRASLPYMKRQMNGDTTTTFRSRSRSFQVYGKFAEVEKQFRLGRASESELLAAVGVIRAESRFLSPQACGRLAKRLEFPDRTAQHLLTGDVARKVLGQTLEQLSLDKPIIPVESRIDLLREHFGGGRVLTTLIAFVVLHDRYGDEFWRDASLGWSRASYYRAAKKLREAGLLLESPVGRTLPPLRIVRRRASKAA